MKRCRDVWSTIRCCPQFCPERTNRGPMNSNQFSRILAAWMLAWTMLAPPAGAQQVPEVVKPHGPAIVRSYLSTQAAPVSLHNSSRLRNLLRSGNLYLTVQDAIALAIE